MPSPVGHILGGAAVYLAAVRKPDRSKATMGLTFFGSIAPDLDFVPGFLIGNLSAYHHGISHSLTFAMLFGAVVFILTPRMQAKVAVRAAILASLGYASHVILDFVGTNEGTRGVPIFWPLSAERLGLDLGLLGYFYYSDSGLWSVVRWDNAPALMRELLIIGSPVLFLLWRERRSSTSD